MLHTKHPTSLRSLKGLPTNTQRAYRARSLWEAVDHAVLLQEVVRACKHHGLMLAKPIIHMDANNLDMVAYYPVERPADDGPYTLGIVNTNSLKYPLALYGGICRSEVCVPMYAYKIGKHTRGLATALARRVDEAVGDFVVDIVTGEYVRTVTKLEKITPEISEVDRLLRIAGTAKLMPWSRIGKIHTLLRESSTKSLWDLLRCFAEAARMNPTIRQIHQVNRFRELLLGTWSPADKEEAE